MLHKLLIVFQVILAILLMGAILLQSRGASLGQAFGGSSAFYSVRRGAEKSLFIITIILAVLFVVVSILQLFF